MLAGVRATTTRVSCAGCGTVYDLSKRNEHLHRRRGTQPRCVFCRRSSVLAAAPTSAEVGWWIDTLGRAEAVELARSVFGPRAV